MRVVRVRRYPVKSCAGESLDEVAVEARGLAGDRGWAVGDEDGKLASGKDTRRFRRLDPVFELAARLGDRPVPQVRFPDSAAWLPVDGPDADARLRAHFARPVRFRPEGPVDHMDSGRVSLVGTASLAALGALLGTEVDPRRFRVNLVIETEVPWEEEGWLGHEVRIGSVVLRPVAVIPRCRMVDIAQDGVAREPGLLKAIGGHRDLRFAVYADVAVTGSIAVDDAVLV
ncbi:MOSC domain-containing protein [Nocardioides sp. AE5]|uniref:MOSC domain-containing protein n=1 Tax=Nocardioides sp. AE5 TaxID=2962573 RepID=UPI002882829E|nr:MOSC N-terminal beta barrel domain-containing protein [Nocardioides sp. AE5]MDT0203285.1 MOSC domain-containing protein [Nocardioides sp. AE5]